MIDEKCNGHRPSAGSRRLQRTAGKSLGFDGKAVIASLLLLAGAATVRAQTYAIDWRTIDGGGGMSTGGAYALNGTLGQPDAARMTGGPYALTSGFWSLVDVVQTPGLPALSIERLPGGAVRVFWTRPAEGIVLEEVSAINGSSITGWSLVAPATYQTNATHVFISIPNPTGMRVYRLRRL